MPGWDEWYREATRKFAHRGYAAISPNLYFRSGHGTPEDVAAKVRGAGGIPDDQAVGDIAGGMLYLRSLPYINGKAVFFGPAERDVLAELALEELWLVAREMHLIGMPYVQSYVDQIRQHVHKSATTVEGRGCCQRAHNVL